MCSYSDIDIEKYLPVVIEPYKELRSGYLIFALQHTLTLWDINYSSEPLCNHKKPPDKHINREKYEKIEYTDQFDDDYKFKAYNVLANLSKTKGTIEIYSFVYIDPERGIARAYNYSRKAFMDISLLQYIATYQDRTKDYFISDMGDKKKASLLAEYQELLYCYIMHLIEDKDYYMQYINYLVYKESVSIYGDIENITLNNCDTEFVVPSSLITNKLGELLYLEIDGIYSNEFTFDLSQVTRIIDSMVEILPKRIVISDRAVAYTPLQLNTRHEEHNCNCVKLKTEDVSYMMEASSLNPFGTFPNVYIISPECADILYDCVRLSEVRGVYSLRFNINNHFVVLHVHNKDRDYHWSNLLVETGTTNNGWTLYVPEEREQGIIEDILARPEEVSIEDRQHLAADIVKSLGLE